MTNPIQVPAAAEYDPASPLSLFDPDNLGPIERVPLIPDAMRKRHQVFVPADHRFKAAARFLQVLWREDRDLPIGHHTGSSGKRRRLGSRIGAPVGDLGANFIHPDIVPVVARPWPTVNSERSTTSTGSRRTCCRPSL